ATCRARHALSDHICFFFDEPPTPALHPLSLHDALPIYTKLERGSIRGASPEVLDALARALRLDEAERAHLFDLAHAAPGPVRPRSEEHTSELQSRFDLVCRLLLEKKK